MHKNPILVLGCGNYPNLAMYEVIPLPPCSQLKDSGSNVLAVEIW